MSAPGKYRRPQFRVNEWFGEEKRRTDRLGRLNRELFEVSREANDPYELAAHLEALGFSNERVQAEFSLVSTFELARKLFQMSKRRPDLQRRSYLQLPRLGWRQLLILAAIVATLALARGVAEPQWLMTLFLISWSVVGSSQIMRAKASLNEAKQNSLFSLLMLLGLLGLGILGLLNGSAVQYAIALLWWGVTGCIWLEELFERRTYWVAGLALALLAMLAFPFLKVPLSIILGLEVLICSFLFLPRLRYLKGENFRFLTEDLPLLMTQLGYATGFGILFLKLIQMFSGHLWVYSGLLALFLFLAEWFALGLKNSLADAMWISTSVEDYLQNSLGSSKLLLRYIILFVFFSLLLAAMFFFPVQAASISHFVLFAIAMILVLMLFSLQNWFLPALAFVLAGLASLFAVPLIWIFVGLALVLVLILFIQLQHVEEYGFHIIG